MSGCYLDDALLVWWERQLLRAVQQPVRRGGRWWWNLDRVPRATLAALCWPRQPMAA